MIYICIYKYIFIFIFIFLYIYVANAKHAEAFRVQKHALAPELAPELAPTCADQRRSTVARVRGQLVMSGGAALRQACAELAPSLRQRRPRCTRQRWQLHSRAEPMTKGFLALAKVSGVGRCTLPHPYLDLGDGY